MFKQDDDTKFWVVLLAVAFISFVVVVALWVKKQDNISRCVFRSNTDTPQQYYETVQMCEQLFK